MKLYTTGEIIYHAFVNAFGKPPKQYKDINRIKNAYNNLVTDDEQEYYCFCRVLWLYRQQTGRKTLPIDTTLLIAQLVRKYANTRV